MQEASANCSSMRALLDFVILHRTPTADIPASKIGRYSPFERLVLSPCPHTLLSQGRYSERMYVIRLRSGRSLLECNQIVPQIGPNVNSGGPIQDKNRIKTKT